MLRIGEGQLRRATVWGSLSLSELSPYRGISPMVFSHRFPSLPLLHLGRPVVLSHDGNKHEVILHNGCACAPGLYPSALPYYSDCRTKLGYWGRTLGQSSLHPNNMPRM